MPSPDDLPIEARRAAWDALWRRLLSDPPQNPEPEHDEHDDEAADAA